MRAMLIKQKYEFLGSGWPCFMIFAVYGLVRPVLSMIDLTSFAGVDLFFMALGFLMMGMAAVSDFTKDIQNKTLLTLNCTPLSRSGYLLSFYVFSLITALALDVLEVLVTLVSALGAETLSLTALASRLLVGTAVCMIPAVIFIPVSATLVNADKGARALASGLMGGTMGGGLSITAQRLDTLTLRGSLITMTVVLIATVLSYVISVLIFNRKDLRI